MSEHPGWTPPRIGSQEHGFNDRLIVNCAVGLEYRRRQRSTINHCDVHCPDAWKLWYDELPNGCPLHEEHQYRFKIAALSEAIDVAAFRHVLWIDTSFQPIASLEPLWQRIAEVGYYVPRQGDSMLGTWTSDVALKQYGITRDSAMKIPLAYSGLVGIDASHKTGRAIWEGWKALADSFDGAHYNEPGLHEWRRVGYKWYGHCSHDPRCEGHRHDEAALSFVLAKLGLAPDSRGFLTIDNPEHGIIGHCVPDYDVVAMRQKCLDYMEYLSPFAHKEEYGGIEKICR